LAKQEDRSAIITEGIGLLKDLPTEATNERTEVELALASAYFFSQEEKAATSHAQAAYTLASAAADTVHIMQATRLMAELLFAANRYEDALPMEQEGVRLARASADRAHLVKFLGGVADNYLMMGEPDSAEQYYRQCLANIPADDPGSRFVTEANLAKLLSERGDHTGAIAILEPSAQRLEELGEVKYYKALNMLAYVYTKAGRHREAVALFLESERLNQESEKDISTTLENLGFTAESQAALGDHSAAYTTMLRLEEQLHAYYERTANDEILALEQRFGAERKEKENAILRAENDVRRLNEERLRNRWIAAAALAALLVGVLALLYRNYRIRSQHARDMERVNAELQRVNDLLSLRVLRAQLNPHFIHNCQNSAISLVKEGKGEEALRYLQGLSKLMRSVLEHSVNDRISIEEEMEFLRLYVKLESMRIEGLTCTVEADRDLLDEGAVLPALLVQPFVENALWHGLANKQGTRELSIRFTATTNGLRCTVTDNGTGRQVSGTPVNGHRSYGTELTNERLQILTHRLQQKGSFTIHDHHDGAGKATGTEVVIELEG
jgi:tetratricopeptide (TPR) repeat protein